MFFDFKIYFDIFFFFDFDENLIECQRHINNMIEKNQKIKNHFHLYTNHDFLKIHFQKIFSLIVFNNIFYFEKNMLI